MARCHHTYQSEEQRRPTMWFRHKPLLTVVLSVLTTGAVAAGCTSHVAATLKVNGGVPTTTNSSMSPTTTTNVTSTSSSPSSPSSVSPVSTPVTSRPIGTSLPLPRFGTYADGQPGTPRYVLTISGSPSGVEGWLYFVYQDGHTSEVLHYGGHSASGGATLHTNVAAHPFNIGTPPPFPQVGSKPLAVGRELRASYTDSSITLSGCAKYLYWARSSASYPHPNSCTFTYQAVSSRS